MVFNEDHKKLSGKVNKAYIKYVKSRNTEDYKVYRLLLNKYRRKCRRDRNHAWKRFIDGTNKAKDVARLSKCLRGIERNSVGVFDKEEGG